jgi:hypothetical protein
MRITIAGLRATATGRKFDPDAAESAIVRRYDDVWVEVDTQHPAYPRVSLATQQPVTVDPAPLAAGPGTELKGLLKLIGITSSPTCSCNARAKQMDEWGPDECERRMPEILAWLEQEATRRGLPFVRFAAEQAVKLAIRRARKSARREPSGDING